jgi:hypothetical protein
MNVVWQNFVSILLLTSSSLFALGDEYYQQFCAVRGTNVSRNLRIQAPLLLDTNNVAFKVTNLVMALTQARGRGELAGIRIGMTMQEVVAAWGKPPQYIWSWCYGGPRLCYTDASAIFDPLTNQVIKVRLEVSPHLSEIPSPAITVEDAIRALGLPSERTENPTELRYLSPQESLRLRFLWNGRLFWVQSEQPESKDNSDAP